MGKYVKWIAIFVILAALVVFRANTDFISKHYLADTPRSGEFTIEGEVGEDGTIQGSGRWTHDGTIKNEVPIRITGSVADAGAIEDVKGAIEFGGFHFGFWSVVPPLLTLVLAFTTRQVILALFVGIAAGGIVSGQFDVLSAYILPSIGSAKFAQILLIYLWCLGGLIGIWSRTGGAERFANWAAHRFVKGPKSAKLFAYFMGLVFHQGGTISTILAGTTVKPVCDEENVSHEELSYIVDSTGSPVATLIPFNIWPTLTGALVVGTASFLSNIDEAVAFYFRAIPFNFYAIIAITFTLLTSLELMPWYGKRMRKAIDRSRNEGKLDADGAQPMTSKELARVSVPDGYKPSRIDFLIPLGSLIGIAGVPFFLTGIPAINLAFFSALLITMVLAIMRGMSLNNVINGFIDGVKGVTIGAIILGLAVTLGNVSQELGTAEYLVENLSQIIPPFVLPASFLLVCMMISFSTGSSFGTYAVVLPIAMPLAVEVARVAQLSDPILFVTLCFSAVIGGAVYGDNCSPISDTTILSSVATGCDLMDHTYTQLPMATLAAIMASVLYTSIAFMTY